MTDWNETFASAVRNDFATATSLQPGLTLRAYSRQIKTPVSTLSEVMSGKVKLTPLRAAIIVDQLQIHSREKIRLKALMKLPTPIARQPLSQDDCELFCDWTSSAVLHFFELEGVDTSPESLGQRLGMKPDKIQALISRLIERGFLTQDETGELKLISGAQWTSSDGNHSESIRQTHRAALNAATRSIDDVPLEKRDVTLYVFAGNNDQIDFVRSEIRTLYERISAVVEGASPRNELFQLSVQFFPIDFSKTPEPS